MQRCVPAGLSSTKKKSVVCFVFFRNFVRSYKNVMVKAFMISHIH